MSRSLLPTVALAGLVAIQAIAVAQGRPKPGDEAVQAAGKRILADIGATHNDMAALRERLLGPVRVNGQLVPADQVRREAVFLVGAPQLTGKVLEFIIEEWKNRFIEDGKRKAEDFVVDEKAIEAEIQKALSKFRGLYPNLDFWEVVRAQTGMSKRQHIQNSRVTYLFNKVFFPGAPDQWPAVTAEAIKAGSQGNQGEDFWDGLVKQGRNEDGTPREMPGMWMEMIRRLVIQQLIKWSDIKYPVDGTPPGVVVDVNGTQWKTEDAFKEIKEALFLQDMERAFTEVVIREALTQELKKHGAYLSDKGFKKAYADFSKDYEGTLFSVEMIARAFKGYPTLEAFRQRWRLIRSFEDLIAKDINDENLQAHADLHKRFFADGSVNADVIPFMAKDRFTGGWKRNGLAEAKKRAQVAMALIQGGTDFDTVLDKQGEFYVNDKERGRLGTRSLNDLRRVLRESEYTELLDGSSLGYHTYYQAEVGKVEGPLRGADAYYLVRVNSRGPASGPVDVSNQQTRDLVKQDYVSYRFVQWTNEVLARTKIESPK